MAIALFLSAIASMGATAASAQEDADVRQELDARYKQLAEAHDKRDLKAILALKTADFHAIFPDGKIGDCKTMEEYSKQFLEKNEPPYNIKITIQELKVSENKLIAIATVLQEASRFREMEGQRRKVDTSVIQDETWSKTADGWKLKLVENVRDQKRFVDGKRVDPSKPYNPNDPPYNPEEGEKKSP
jgi:ketosteroid isomerase-like protein